VLGFAVLAVVNSALLWILICAVSLGLLVEALMRRKPADSDPDLEGVTTVSLEPEVHGEERRPIGLPVVTLIVALFFLIGGNTIGNALSSAFGTSFIDVRPSWQATFDIGSHTLASSPLFGSGPGTFGEQWLVHRDRALNDTIFWNVDFVSGIGFVPTSMVTTGVIGIIAWLAFFAAFAFAGVRALLLRLPQSRLARFVSIFSFLGSAYVLVLAVFATPGPVVLIAGYALLGVFISSTRFGRDKAEFGIVFSRNPRLGFLIVFSLTLLLIATVYAAYAITVRYLSSVAYGDAATALAAGDVNGAESAVIRSLSFGETDRAYRLAAAVGVARMNEIALSETLAPSDAQTQFQSALASSVQAAIAATNLGPKNYQNWLALGGVYQSVVPLQIEGAAEQASLAYEQAGKLAPSNPVIPFTLAQLDIIAADYASAETRLLEAIALKRDYTQAILMYSQLQVQLGKATEALQAVEAAIYFAPNDPATLFQAGLLRLGTNDRAGAIQALARAVELNTNYANARFFLAVAHASAGDLPSAIAQLEAVAALSEENAAAVAADLAALRDGTNPYPLSRMRTLGIPYPPVEEPAPDLEAGSAE
jgi:tetratricopeptide (TPR) repeat protein